MADKTPVNTVAGGFCPPSQEFKRPPQLSFKRIKAGDVPKSSKAWSDDHLPIDILLLTTENKIDFLSCFSLLDRPFKSYKVEIGHVYFGGMGDASDQEKLKIALMNCPKGSITPGGSSTAVLNAVKVLRPKAAFLVGTCISLGLEKVRMGDVVIASKLTAEGFRTPVSPLLGSLIQDAPYGWVAPLENLDELEVKVHCDGDILSQSLREKCRCDNVCEQYPEAVAIETEGKAVYAAAYDANIEWVIVKGVASYVNQSQSATSEWMYFASTMAASMVGKMLHDPTVFREWPNYNQGRQVVMYGKSEDQHSLREYRDASRVERKKGASSEVRAGSSDKDQTLLKERLKRKRKTYSDQHKADEISDLKEKRPHQESHTSVGRFIVQL
ncbi:PREDICTED: uncharacterized protein LOC107345557 [Acropora digitifera]|uniref:uncharacterized protein LOC107345557 n=1 Tax=Acropora digitifera TaxID=70779 RepID=UPI00077A32F3|nr:PREDICTED: uncharacterized protein LOC107345557 [Acropora digitifera]